MGKCPALNVKGEAIAGPEFDKPPLIEMRLKQVILKQEIVHANYVFFLTKVMFNHTDINLVRRSHCAHSRENCRIRFCELVNAVLM